MIETKVMFLESIIGFDTPLPATTRNFGFAPLHFTQEVISTGSYAFSGTTEADGCFQEKGMGLGATHIPQPTQVKFHAWRKCSTSTPTKKKVSH